MAADLDDNYDYLYKVVLVGDATVGKTHLPALPPSQREAFPKRRPRRLAWRVIQRHGERGSDMFWGGYVFCVSQCLH